MKRKAIWLISLFATTELVYANNYPELNKFIAGEQYAQAYQQASKLRSQNEGDPRFDFLYGLAALQTGHYNEAVFALERVKASSPNVIRPRLELARAYLKLNNKRSALQEFKSVLQLSPPPAVKRNVESYIAALEKQKSQLKIGAITKKLASFSVGYDDNINFGVDDEFIDIPAFGSVQLNPDSVKKGSGFAESRLQLQQRRVRNRLSSTFTSANLIHREYFKDNEFNLTDLDLRTGILWNRDNNQYQLILRDRPVLLGGSLYSNTLGVDAIARRALDKNRLGSISLSVENYDYKPLGLADKKRAYVSGRLDFNQGSALHQISTSLGREFPDDDDGKQYSRDIAAVAYKMTQNWNANNKSFFGVNYGNYRHRDVGSLSPEKRRDKRVVVDLGHEYVVNENTAVLVSLRHIDNNSNQDLYDASRNEIRVGVRYEWD